MAETLGNERHRYCLCNRRANDWSGELMVECDNNKANACEYGWYHPSCIGMQQTEIANLDQARPWFCPCCLNKMQKEDQEQSSPLRRSKRTCVRRKRQLRDYSELSPPPRKKRRVEHTTPRTRKRSALQTHNEMMKAKNQTLRRKRLQWIKANFKNFQPYLTERGMRKLGLSDQSCAGVLAPLVDPLSEQPLLLNGGAGATLRDYQLRSLNWMRNLRHWGATGVLADEMGLGKTIQSLAALASLLEEDGARGPHLIVCPLSVAEAWHDEARKWLPQMRTVLFHGPTQQRKAIMENKLLIGQFDICICTYEIAVSHQHFLAKFFWYYLVLDEAHRIKNENTRWHAAVKNVRALHTLLLTGTPIQNTMHELWALLHFSFPEVFPDSEPFDRVFEHISMEHDKSLLGKIPKLLQPFYLRRLKCDVEHSLPPKEEIIVRLAMSQEQMKWYKMFLSHHANLLDKVSDEYNNATHMEWKKLRALFVQLRKIALHPYLLPNLQDQIVPRQSLIDASGKLQVMDALLTRLKRDGHRVLLFSCFTATLDLIEVYMEYRRWKYLRLDGSTNRIRRKVDISRFNAPGSDYFVYLISNRAGGLGINLQTADTVIHFDTDWNPQADLQAQARAHRIGQTKMVKIYRLICQDTIEERILFRSQQKLYLDAIVNKGAKMLQDNAVDELDMGDNDLLATIRFGAEKLFQADDRNIGGVDLDALLERSHTIQDDNGNPAANESRSALLSELNTNNVRDFNFKLGLVAGNVFQGVTYKKAEHVESILNLENRTRTNKTETVFVDGIKLQVDVSSRWNQLTTFYQYSSNNIFDRSNRSQDLHHEPYCWGCDTALTESDRGVIQCSQCPKSFHGKCWTGTLSRMGVYVCGQHQCYSCTAKSSQCGMLFRCVGCVQSFCPEDAPLAHWIRPDLGGMHYLDGCPIAEHYGYRAPSSTYMWICCSDECKAYYETNYSKRIKMDFSMKYDQLPEKLKDALRLRQRKLQQGGSVNQRTIGSMLVDQSVAKLSAKWCQETVSDRLYFLDQDCDIVQELYHLLGGRLPESEKSDIMEEQKDREEPKPSAVAIPPTIPEDVDVEMKTPHRVFVPHSRLDNTILTPVTNSVSHCGMTPMMSELAVGSIASFEVGDVEMKETSNDEQALVSAASASSVSLPSLRSASLASQETEPSVNPPEKPDPEPPTNFVGHICSWQGYVSKNAVGTEEFKAEIVEEYERLYQSFSHWKAKSLKTLLDVLGCVVVTRKISNGENILQDVALSHPRTKLSEHLVSFLLLADHQFLRIPTDDLRR